MATGENAFAPRIAATSNFTASTVTASGTSIVIADANAPPQSLLVQNGGPSIVFFDLGASATSALVATSTPLFGGQSRVLSLGNATKISAITSSGTATVWATPGEGAT